MAFLDSMQISASALTASRLRMDVISENMASSNTTRTEDGGPYRRKFVIYQEKTRDSSYNKFRNGKIKNNRPYATFGGVLSNSWGGVEPADKGLRVTKVGREGHVRAWMNKADHAVGGVRVIKIQADESDFKLDYDPTHPDADENGYVRYPNVEVVNEMVDMMAAYRAYEANITALNSFKDMAVKTLELGR